MNSLLGWPIFRDYVSFREGIYISDTILLMVQKSGIHHLRCTKKPCRSYKSRIDYQPQLVNLGFPNHQQYHEKSDPQ